MAINSPAKPASGRAMTQPMARTSRLPSVMRRTAAGAASEAITGGMAPPRLAPSTSTMIRLSGSAPVEASDRISTTAASDEEETKATPADSASATGQALASRPKKAASAGDSRIGSVAAPSRCSEVSIRPMPTSARPPPRRAIAWLR